MSESINWMFNTCPLCKEKGEKIILFHKKGSDLSDPCRGCGTKFRCFAIDAEQGMWPIGHWDQPVWSHTARNTFE